MKSTSVIDPAEHRTTIGPFDAPDRGSEEWCNLNCGHDPRERYVSPYGEVSCRQCRRERKK